jgi:NAD(P)-dependent dehydrogenase (short-subunit alcohol dehydrogenase family)
VRVSDSVVVLTGASSGLGRATAFELASRGATLVLAARRVDALLEVARACERLGARASVVETDVTREDEVARLAAAAVAEHGRIDVWINNAGVTLYAPLEQGPFEHHRRVIETNLFGAMYGARAVVPIFRRQHSGVMINVGSVLSEVGQAFVPTYAISKFGLRGLSEALRVELADQPDIHICTILPYAIDTPHFQVAANLLNRQPRALPPMQSPERVARAIAGMIERPRRMRHVPRSVVLGLVLHALFPRTVERLLLDALRRWHMSSQPEVRGDGNLYVPNGDAKVHGDRGPLLGTTHFLAWCAQRLVHNALRGA